VAHEKQEERIFRPNPELTDEENYLAGILFDLRGKKCFGCGGPKMPGYTCCKACFMSLPHRIRRPLIRMLHPNYVAAFELAKEELKLPAPERSQA
jgi:hypothetical protein